MPSLATALPRGQLENHHRVALDYVKLDQLSQRGHVVEAIDKQRSES